jgi:hypothetical protein
LLGKAKTLKTGSVAINQLLKGKTQCKLKVAIECLASMTFLLMFLSHPGVNPKTYTTKCEQYERGTIPPYSNAINVLEREHITTFLQ